MKKMCSLLFAALTGVVLLTGCGSSDEASSPETSTGTPTPTDTATSPSSAPTDLTALLPEASDLVEFGEVASPWQAGPATPGFPETWLGRPCVDGEPPSEDAVAYRDFTPGGEPLDDSWHAQAVLYDYDDETAAQAAYDDLAGFFAGCRDAVRADGGTDVGKVHESDVAGATAKTYFLTFTGDPDDHAVTQQQRAVALDGTHLLTVFVTQIVQDHWPDLQASMPKIVERLTGTTGLPRTMMFPTQLDYVRLGESYDDAVTGGDLVQAGEGGWQLRTYAGQEGNSVCLGRQHGLEAFFLPEPVRTPEGIGVGSTEAEVRAAYPKLTEDVHGYLHHKLWKGVDYSFGIRDGKVFEAVVEQTNQHCYG